MQVDNKPEKNFISAVVYVHNHEQYLESFIKKIKILLNNKFEKYELIFVNDSSTDKSSEIIKLGMSSEEHFSCTVVNLSYKHGIERAMIAGQDIAIGDFVYEFDTPIIDYEMDEIIKVYNTCLQGFDIVSASSATKNKMTSQFFYKLFRRYSNNNIALNTERFRIISRRGINRIKNLSEIIPYRKAIYFNSGLKTNNITYKPIIDIEKCINTVRFGERADFAINILLFFTNIGWKISSFMSIGMVIFSMFMGGYTITMWISNDSVVEGWTTIMLFLSIVFSAVFILLSIIIKYISLILFINTNKQDYVFESIEKVK